jgi:hypothetical protein
MHGYSIIAHGYSLATHIAAVSLATHIAAVSLATHIAAVSGHMHVKGWPGPIYTVYLAGKSPNIRSLTEHRYGSGQPYACVTSAQLQGHKQCFLCTLT